MSLAATYKTVESSWPLFFGILMIMIGNGLQGTLLGVRASIEGFPTWLTGLVMSFYFLGFLGGTLLVPKFVREVGHIRVFAALASLASTTILFHGLFVHPLSWLPVRLITGFAFSGLFIVVESWLNDAATNKNRGMMMAIYLVVNYLGIMAGQLMLNIADPSQFELFVAVSVLVSLALVPISLSSRPAPVLQKMEKMSLKKLLRISPLGVVGVFQTGVAAAAIFTIMPVFITQIGLGTQQVSIIMALIMFGGMVFQIPIGWLSDQIDRRTVMLWIAALAAATCIAALLVKSDAGIWYYFILFLFGGLSMSMYGLSLSHTNDHVEPDDIVSVSSSMLLINGMGACFGPLLITSVMDIFGDGGYFPFLAVTYILLLCFGIYRKYVSEDIPMEDQGDYVAVPIRNSPVIMQMIEDEEGPVSDGK